MLLNCGVECSWIGAFIVGVLGTNGGCCGVNAGDGIVPGVLNISGYASVNLIGVPAAGLAIWKGCDDENMVPIFGVRPAGEKLGIFPSTIGLRTVS